jgi:hypothetical protein
MVSLIDLMWSPEDGLTTQLWKFGNQGHPKLPSGVPKCVPFCPIWGNDASKSIEKGKIINSGISKYLKFWKLNIVRDEMYAKAMGPCIEYWEGILKCLLKPLPKQSHILLEGFWHLAIGRLIMCNSLLQIHLSLKIKNIQLSLYVVGLKT